MVKRRMVIGENKLIWDVCKLLRSPIVIIPDDQRLDLLIDMDEGERNKLIEFCSRIVTRAADGKRIKLEQLEKRYADQLN